MSAGGHVVAGGWLIAGFDVERRPDAIGLDAYEMCAAVALVPFARWSTWNRDAYVGGDYAVMAHRRPPA